MRTVKGLAALGVLMLIGCGNESPHAVPFGKNIAQEADVPLTAQDEAGAVFVSASAAVPTGEKNLVRFGSEEDFLAYLVTRSDLEAEQGETVQSEAPSAPRPMVATPELQTTTTTTTVPTPSPAPAPSPTPSSPTAATSSSTMLQEIGVDEADKVKHDGEHLYIARGKTLRVVDARPLESMRTVATLAFPDPVIELHFWNGRTVVITQRVRYEYTGENPPPSDHVPYNNMRLQSARVGAISIDMSDPSNPFVIGAAYVDGLLNASRRIGARLFLVLNRAATPWPDRDDPKAIEKALPRAAADPDGTGVRLVEPADVLHGFDLEGENLTTVAAFDLASKFDSVSALVILDKVDVSYMSPSNLYLVRSIVHSDLTASTRIHKIAFDAGSPVYAGSGEVPGKVLDSYSLGEHRGHLRLATEVGVSWNPATRVTVLAEQGGQLTEVGALDNIAPGEALDTARFVGDRGYLFTSIRFIMWDPLFTLDLNDPAAPVLCGQLEMPGYNAHMLPLSDGRLLALGRDGNNRLKLTLFDVSDPAAPAIIETLDLNWRGLQWAFCDSEAMTNPKAFQWYPEQNLLALPVQSSGSDDQWTWQCPLDMVLVEVEGDHLNFLGGVELTDRWYTSWTRAVFFDRDLFAVRNCAIHAVGIDRLYEQVWVLKFD